MTPTSDRPEETLSRALLLLAPTVTVVVAAEFIVVGLLPLVARDLNIPLVRAGELAGWFAFSAAVAGPFVTLMARHLMPRFILTATLLLYGACNTLVAIGSDVNQMLIARIMQGAALPAFISVGASLVTALAPAAERGNALARANLGFVLGVLLALPAGIALAQGGNWRLPFLVLAAISLLLAPLVALRFPRIPATSSGGIGGQLRLLRQPEFLAHLALSVVLFAAMFSAYTYLGAWMDRALGLTAWGVAAAMFLFGLAGLFGNDLAGRVADRAPIRATIVAILLLIASVNLTAFAGDAILLATAPLVLWSVSHAASVTLGQVRVTLAGQMAPSFAMTLNISAANLGIAIGTASGGWIIDGHTIAAIGIAPLGFGMLALPLFSLIGRAASRDTYTRKVSDA
ncbi:MFS transporter [Bradyrhizobium sacchari]|uniref:Putative MFS family arabinose efflux permease n=1 Tax=Bradyrhizobium sacchari TaxID=1399419 RepID=A0A560IQ31_9BRAD|nr:MFS transporter [Bradyrhizobium sacchari]TWB58750.1 putative MFS family arabinose efflux permease [Bradyrhizobium sacchari]TWB72890.1 putative MFS family arabinose efflux permease [Bradyrhizobium sacchari]